MAPAENRAEVGRREINQQAQAGLKLFKEVRQIEGDRDAADAWKTSEDAKIKALEQEAEALTGAENKKARQAKSKEAAALKKADQYIDAELVLKGKGPKHGFFLSAGQELPEPALESTVKASGGYKSAEPAVTPDAKAEPKPSARREERRSAKKQDSLGGLTKDERAELEQLKNDIIHRKAELKGDGLTGAQINKDEKIVLWVVRMNELREKECPGCTGTGKKDSFKEKGAEHEAEAIKLAQEIEEYRQRLVNEFKYNKKEIAADADMADMTARLSRLQRRK